MHAQTLIEQGVHGYRFGNHTLDVKNRVLRLEGEPVALNAKYLDVLICLVAEAGEVVSKETLFERVWSDVFVTDGALTQCIKDIRKTLGDSAQSPRFIKTLPKRGYQFVAPVERLRDGSVTEAIPRRPYKFLESFGEEDAADFHGRADEVDQVASRMAAHATFRIYGRSGVGKSSFLAAGLGPRLRAGGNRVCRVRGKRDPIPLLAHELGFEDPPETLAAMLTRFAETNPESAVFLCFDQFEEWFIEEAADELASLLEPLSRGPAGRQVRFCFVLREDYLARMNDFKALFPDIFHHEYRLELLDRARAERAAAEPASRAGCRFEDGLLDRILDDLTSPEGVDLPALQIVCDQLYDRRDGSGVFGFAAYHALGSTGGILQSYLDRVLRRFSGEDLETARAVLTRMIDADGERLVLPMTALEIEVGEERPGAQVGRILEELARARVLHIGNDQGRRLVSLVHDYLVPAVSRWMTDALRRRQKVREMLRRAVETYREHGFPIGTDGVRLILDELDNPALDETAAELLALSCLRHGIRVPQRLAAICPDYPTPWREALASKDPDLRRNAIASAHVDDETAREAWVGLALDDPDLGVRREASLRLADRYGNETPNLLADGGSGRPWQEHTWRYLVALAMIRDQDRGSFSLWRRSPLVSVFIVVCLAWVRIRRHWDELSRQVVGGTVGTSVAGLGIGLALGLVVVFSQAGMSSNPRAILIAFGFSGLVAGFLAGIAVSAAMGIMVTIAYRHSRFWSVIGGTAGGLCVGAGFTLAANAVSETMMGKGALTLTGAIESALMGAAVCLGAVLAERHLPGSTRRSMIGAALLGGAAALMIVALDGHLLAGSLAGLITTFQVIPEFDSFLTAEVSRTARSFLQLAEAFTEGAVFGSGLFGGILLFRKTNAA